MTGHPDRTDPVTFEQRWEPKDERGSRKMSEMNVNDEMCVCGHVLDEHEDSASSTPACDVTDCDCFAFEEDE